MYNPVILSGNPLCYFMVAVQNFFNPRTYTQIHTLTLLQGGGGGRWWNPTPDFWICCSISKTILPLVESLWPSQQDEVYFVVGSAAGGPWRHRQWFGILGFTKN